jgi:hypothetical protein
VEADEQMILIAAEECLVAARRGRLMIGVRSAAGVFHPPRTSQSVMWPGPVTRASPAASALCAEVHRPIRPVVKPVEV